MDTQEEILSERLNQLETRLQDITAADSQQSEAIITLKNQQEELIDLVESTSTKLSTLSLALKARSEEDRKYLANLGVNFKDTQAEMDTARIFTPDEETELPTGAISMTIVDEAGWPISSGACGKVSYTVVGTTGDGEVVTHQFDSEQKIKSCMQLIIESLMNIDKELQKR